jgi:hypothetical protein
MNTDVPSYRGYRFPPEIISHAVWLYHRFCLSFRDVEDLLAERGIMVTDKLRSYAAAGARNARIQIHGSSATFLVGAWDHPESLPYRTPSAASSQLPNTAGSCVSGLERGNVCLTGNRCRRPPPRSSLAKLTVPESALQAAATSRFIVANRVRSNKCTLREHARVDPPHFFGVWYRESCSS